MSKEKVPAQATLEEQLESARAYIEWLDGKTATRKRDLTERIFMKVYGDGSRGHEQAVKETAEVVAFILGEDSPAQDEIAEIHAYLDSCGTIRGGSPDSTFSLEGRIKAYGIQNWNQGHAVGVGNAHAAVELSITESENPVVFGLDENGNVPH